MEYQLYNGEILPADSLPLSLSNRGLRYGDGLFETMRMTNGHIPLWPLHVRRFFSGMEKLGFPPLPYIDPEELLKEIVQLCEKNNCSSSARIRLSAWRGNGHLYDFPSAYEYAAACTAVPPLPPTLNNPGVRAGVFAAAQKSTDSFANLKSSSFLPYTMGAVHAHKNEWDDCLVLNTQGHIADSTIANVFVYREGKLYTPALDQGCVAGVMRAWLLKHQQRLSLAIEETIVKEEDLLQADEIWLTNAVALLKPVGLLQHRKYGNQFAQETYQKIVSELFTEK